MSDEEKKAIEEQYKKGLVNLSNVIEPLINQFKTDYSLDIQQCRLIINYLLMERDFNEDYYDELDKEIEELKDKNKTLKNLQNDTNRLYIEMIERKNYFEGKLQKLEDKIKAKIEELDYNDIGNFERRCKQEVLQSLLEEKDSEEV